MGYFEASKGTRKVKLPSNDKYWVELAGDIKWGVSKHSLSVDGEGNVDMVMSADKLLRMLIKDWNLDDEQGNKAPITEEWIDRLEPSDAMYLVKEAGGDQVEAAEAKKLTQDLISYFSSSDGKAIVPGPYLEYLLCKKFKWLPSELDEQPRNRILQFLDIMRIEAQFERIEQQKMEADMKSKG